MSNTTNTYRFYTSTAIDAKAAEVEADRIEVAGNKAATDATLADIIIRQGDVATRQGDVITRQADVATRQADVVTRQSNVATMQGQVQAIVETYPDRFSSLATTIFVNPVTGNDLNPGTSGSPVATLQRVAAIVNNKFNFVTIEIAGGVVDVTQVVEFNVPVIQFRFANTTGIRSRVRVLNTGGIDYEGNWPVIFNNARYVYFQPVSGSYTLESEAHAAIPPGLSITSYQTAQGSFKLGAPNLTSGSQMLYDAVILVRSATRVIGANTLLFAGNTLGTLVGANAQPAKIYVLDGTASGTGLGSFNFSSVSTNRSGFIVTSNVISREKMRMSIQVSSGFFNQLGNWATYISLPRNSAWRYNVRATIKTLNGIVDDALIFVSDTLSSGQVVERYSGSDLVIAASNRLFFGTPTFETAEVRIPLYRNIGVADSATANHNSFYIELQFDISENTNTGFGMLYEFLDRGFLNPTVTNEQAVARHLPRVTRYMTMTLRGTGSSVTENFNFPFPTRFRRISLGGGTVTAEPSTTATLAANTNHTVTYNAATTNNYVCQFWPDPNAAGQSFNF